MEILIDGDAKVTAFQHKYFKFSFPACAITKTGNTFNCYLNAPACNVIASSMGINWCKTDNGIVYAVPSKALNAFKPIFMNGRFKGYSFPKSLITSGEVKPGHYKLHRVKSGFGFQTFKRLEDEND